MSARNAASEDTSTFPIRSGQQHRSPTNATNPSSIVSQIQTIQGTVQTSAENITRAEQLLAEARADNNKALKQLDKLVQAHTGNAIPVGRRAELISQSGSASASDDSFDSQCSYTDNRVYVFQGYGKRAVGDLNEPEHEHESPTHSDSDASYIDDRGAEFFRLPSHLRWPSPMGRDASSGAASSAEDAASEDRALASTPRPRPNKSFVDAHGNQFKKDFGPNPDFAICGRTRQGGDVLE